MFGLKCLDVNENKAGEHESQIGFSNHCFAREAVIFYTAQRQQTRAIFKIDFCRPGKILKRRTVAAVQDVVYQQFKIYNLSKTSFWFLFKICDLGSSGGKILRQAK